MGKNNKLYEEASLWIQKEKEGLSKLQKHNLEKWLENKENKKVYEEVKQIEESIFKMPEDLKEKLRNEVNNEIEKTSSFKPFLLAACLLLFIGVGIFNFDFKDENFYSRTLLSQNSVQNDILLPDKSKISLDAKTELHVSFLDNKRQVEFTKGRALFDVSKDKQRAFVIYTKNNISVEVLGTSFEVSKENDITSVKVKEGRVKVGKIYNRDKESKIISLLEKGDSVTLDKYAKVITNKKVPIEQIAIWQDNNISFDDIPLKSAINEFLKYSKYKISLDRSLERINVTGNFKTYEVEEFLNSLTLIYPIKIKKENSQISLEKKI